MINNFIGEKPEIVLKKVFGYDDFRPLQKEIIENVLSKRDTLAIMPTGGGKSLCYQIPALIFEGITIVISPLIALMQNQVSELIANGVNAVFLNSSLEKDEYFKTVAEIENGRAKLIYVSPEGLTTSRVQNILHSENIRVDCITIDEAHCVSDWGHDFRPDYLEIASVKKTFPEAVCLALTATATKQVQNDICSQLKMKKPAVLTLSFNRENIFLEVRPKKNALSQVVSFLEEHRGESGIIYCFSRKQVDSLTESLTSLGFSALNYHAGLDDKIRSKNQEMFIFDKVEIMVATVAFGMGINKSNVRFVIHYDMPKSLEEYYQEIGRAGRDGLESNAILLYSSSDIYKIRFFFEDSFSKEKSESLLQGMISYATSKTCRRRVLLGYFGENFLSDKKSDCCCDICKEGPAPLSDVTVPAQKLMSCILRVNQRFGASYIVDILLGSRQKRIMDNNHNMLSTWGIGCELSKDSWFDLVDAMIASGYIVKTGDYNILNLTYAGRSVLTSREKIELPLSLPHALSKTDFKSYGKFEKPSKKVAVLHKKITIQDSEGKRIAEALKEWRRKISEEENVPPYVIFGDKTLLDIAQKKPRNVVELKTVYGIGGLKAEKFGSAILRIVASESQS